MKQNQGVLLTILSAFLFGFTPILAKWTYSGGSNAISLTFYRALFSLPVLYGILKYRKVSLKMTKSQWIHLLIVGILGQTVTTITLYATYDYLSVGMATTLHFVYPAFVVLAAVLYFKEKWTRAKVISIILAMIGMLCFIDLSGHISLYGVFLALVSGMTYAFFILYIDKSGLKELDSFKLTFYINLVVSAAVFVYGMGTHSLMINLTPIAWGLTLIISLLVSVFAVALLQIGIKLIGSTKASILCLFEPITSVVFGLILLHEDLTILKLTGCILILLSAYAISKEK
ncbi:DMT family transporter [Turicibacter sanguinis]|uniref:DMT family transporter n=1 Tax=Turicibacter sanguinis TaxID=154288 RepID=UPI002942E0B1|nr:DMT family transporter [Turicibacter sanguinis]